MHLLRLAAFTAIALGGIAQAADHDPTAPRVPRTASPPKVDGVLDDTVWAEAVVLELKYETRPAENGPAKVRTRVLMAYDADALYIAFDAEDPDPSKIRARLRDRDRAYDDDFVGIVVDPFDDHLRAFEFFANPLGVQMDLFQDDVTHNEDDTWDAIWDSAGQVNATGFAVEMAIPMRALRFAGGGAEQLWGFDIIRMYPREERYRLSVRPNERGRNCYLCQNIHLRGFEGITPGNNLEVVPALVMTQSDARPGGYGTPMEQGELEVEPSLDVRWGVTPNVMLNGTLNPDFSQVEADSAQLAVNTTFALFYPEKRPFFLEGADIFQSQFDVVYTRNIAEPDYGLKVSGKSGAHAFGAFAADDQVLNLIFPGSQGSDFGTFAIPTQNQVARYRRDMGNGSTLGALVTHRAGDGYENLVFGTDGTWRIAGPHSANFQVLGSRTEYPAQVAIDYAQPAGAFTDQALKLEYNYDAREYHFFALYQDVGEGFRADMGFMPQVDYRKPVVGGSRVWHLTGGFWNQVQLRADWDKTQQQSGAPLEEEVEFSLSGNGRYQSYLEVAMVRRIDQVYAGQHFPHEFYASYGEFTPTSWFSGGLYVRGGGAIDFANVRPATMQLIEPWLTLRPGQHLNLNLSTSFQTLDVTGGTLFDAELVELRATWQFSTRSYLRLITQHVDVRNDPSLYTFAVDERTQDLNNQLLFAYKINPQTVFFLGYSDGWYAVDEDDFEQQGRTLFLKMSYAWLL
jgi:hypothetical protein